MSSRRSGRVGVSGRPSYSRRWYRTPLVVVGAVGAVGLAVVYFFDPLDGPRRRREVYEWMHDTTLEAWRRSQELVSRLVAVEEPVGDEGADAPFASAEGPDLADALREEVTFTTMATELPREAGTTLDGPNEEDATWLEPAPVPVGVAARHETRTVAAVASDEPRVSYLRPETPTPTIIAFDATGAGDEPALVGGAAAPDAPVEGESQADEVRRGVARGALAGAAVAAVLLAGAGLGAWALLGTDDEGTVASPTTPSGVAEAIELISQGARSLPVQGSAGTMVLVAAPDGRAALVISGLEQAPPGKEYQAWVVTGGEPHSAGLFKGGVTRLVVPLDVRVPKGAIVAVTVEVVGGVPAPTQKPRYTVQRA